MWFARFPSNVPADWLRALDGIVWMAEDGSEACACLHEASGVHMPPAMPLVRLEQTMTLAGEAHGHDALWHYVVATDVSPGHEVEFNAWYDTEHLAGLVGVPGVAKATRYRVVEGAGPLYHASYDLAQRSAFNSAAWLAVRGTPWSSRVRPSFVNTPC